MRLVILLVLTILVGGCSIVQDGQNASIEDSSAQATDTISGVRDLVLTEEDLRQLGVVGDGCSIEEYVTDEFWPLSQYGFCNYAASALNGTDIVIELHKFTNEADRNGTYQYTSSHLYGAKGLISENEYGDQSSLRVNSEDDYGAEFNEQGIYYYHLWFTEDLYLVHITSKGSKDADALIAGIGRRIESKFG